MVTLVGINENRTEVEYANGGIVMRHHMHVIMMTSVHKKVTSKFST